MKIYALLVKICSVTASAKRVKVDCSVRFRPHSRNRPHVFDNRFACLAARSFFVSYMGGPIKCLYVCACEHAQTYSRLIGLLQYNTSCA